MIKSHSVDAPKYRAKTQDRHWFSSPTFPFVLAALSMALPLLNVNLVANNNIGWQQSSLLKSKLIVEENQNPLDPNYKRKSKVLRCVEKQRKEACAERSQRLRLV